jgi:AcrR family transcriptional regulator
MPPVRAAAAPAQLLVAAVDVFGKNGFAGTSTRMLASAAGLNLQAIAYHFGGKEGLYLAAADHIGERISARIAPLRELVRARLDARAGQPLAVRDARALLRALLSGLAAFFFDDETMAFARFMVREQMEPTAAFDRLYAKVLGPQLEVLGGLVAIILGDRPDAEAVRVRTLGLVGMLISFRIANATLVRQLGWSKVGPRQLAAVNELIRDTVAGLRRRRTP